MSFNSVQYALFLPVAVIGYFLLPPKLRNGALLAASYFFYACWVPEYLVLIVFSTFVTWLTGFIVDRTDRPTARKTALAINIIINLGILFVFKYYNFFMISIGRALSLLNVTLPFAQSTLLLPVGISFYTFQALSYSIDVYRRDVTHEKNFINYALFVSFFPQLVAGPIERTKNLLPQLKETTRRFNGLAAGEGCRVILVGLFKKIVCADICAIYVNAVFGHIEDYSSPVLVLAVLLFAIQIYCDFSGYSDIARGSALLFGIRLMENFNAPYFSTSITEFWSRWHISLSTWFRDYLYIPLGGNRKGFARKCVNLMIVFLISGLWHGASFTFLAWGCLHGIYRAFEEILRKIRPPKQDPGRLRQAGKTVLCLIAVCFAWIFFRAASITQAFQVIRGIFGPWNISGFWDTMRGIFMAVAPTTNTETWAVFLALSIPFSAGIILFSDFMRKYRNKPATALLRSHKKPLRWGVYYFSAIVVLFFFILQNGGFGQAVQFIYFQF